MLIKFKSSKSAKGARGATVSKGARVAKLSRGAKGARVANFQLQNSFLVKGYFPVITVIHHLA